MGLIKDAFNYYKAQKRLEKARKQMLNSKTDFALLELFIQKCNANPGLKIKVTTNDGAIYELQTFDNRNRAFSVSSKINGDADKIDQMIEEYIS